MNDVSALLGLGMGSELVHHSLAYCWSFLSCSCVVESKECKEDSGERDMLVGNYPSLVVSCEGYLIRWIDVEDWGRCTNVELVDTVGKLVSQSEQNTDHNLIVLLVECVPRAVGKKRDVGGVSVVQLVALDVSLCSG